MLRGQCERRSVIAVDGNYGEFAEKRHSAISKSAFPALGSSVHGTPRIRGVPCHRDDWIYSSSSNLTPSNQASPEALNIRRQMNAFGIISPMVLNSISWYAQSVVPENLRSGWPDSAQFLMPFRRIPFQAPRDFSPSTAPYAQPSPSRCRATPPPALSHMGYTPSASHILLSLQP